MNYLDAAKFGIESTGLLVSCFLYFHSKTKIKENRSLLEFIQRAYIFSPKTFLEILQENSKSIFRDNFLNFHENENEAELLGFVQGVVDSPTPISSILNNKKALISSKIKAQPLYSNAQSIEGKDYLVKTFNCKSFVLKDPKCVNTMVVLNGDKCDKEFALKKIAEKSDYRNFHWLEIVITKLIWLIQLSLGVLRLYPTFKGFLIGVKTTEYGIEVGQKILTFGKIKFDKLNKLLLMEHPLFLLNDKSQMAEFHQNDNLKWTRISSLSICFGIVFGLLVIRRISRFLRNLIDKIKLSLESLKIKKLRRFSETLNDDFKCIICIENPKNVIFKPCLHMALCKNCFLGLRKPECPICKKNIKNIVNVFLV